MQYVLLIIGTVLGIAFIYQMNRGEEYSNVVANLDGGEYPLAPLFIVGFVWNTVPIFTFRDKKAADLKTQAVIIHGVKYADYYAMIAWVQMITYLHLFLAITCLAAAFLFSMSKMILLAGVLITVAMAYNALEGMKNTIKERTEECERELPEVVSTLAVLVSSGMMLREAWSVISESKEGVFYDLMKETNDDMKNGYSDIDAIFLFGKKSDSTEVKKFTTALIQSMEKGGAELGVFLAMQSSEMWNAKRQRMLQSGEKAATKLLAPIMLIFVGILIIVLTAAFGGSLF